MQSAALLLRDRHHVWVWPHDVVLPENWLDLRGAAGEHARAAAALQAELEREVAHGHPLAGSKPTVIARSLGSDDVLVHLVDGRAALVHLTWARSGRQPQDFPTTVFVGSQEEFDAQMDE